MLSDLNLRPYKIHFPQPLNEDYKQKRLVFAQNMKQLRNANGINVKQIFFLTKLIFIYMDILTNKITGFGHASILT